MLRTMRATRLSSSGSLFATPQFSMLLRGCSIAWASSSLSSDVAVAGGARKTKMRDKEIHAMATNCGGSEAG